MSEPVEAEVIEADHLPAVRASEAIMARGELSVDEVVEQKDKILQIMQRVMTEKVHYGVIPGVNKPSLFKPGAEAINVALRLAPFYESEKTYHDDGHLTVSAVCTLKHIPTSLVIAQGEGLCTSREAKYGFRTAKRTCPACGAAAIIKGKAEYGGGWVCWKKEGGCGANYADNDQAIVTQPEGRIQNPDLADTWNTILKMADKRALIAAVLNGTAASDVFTQDAEDRGTPQEAEPEPAPEKTRSQTGPGPFPVPRSWAKVQEEVRGGCDNPDEAWALFEAFVRAASYHLFGKTDSKELDAAQRKTMLQKAAGAAVALAESTAAVDGPFVLYDVEVVKQAWASVLDGALLAIPDYVAPIDMEQASLDEEAARQAEDAP